MSRDNLGKSNMTITASNCRKHHCCLLHTDCQQLKSNSVSDEKTG